MSTGYFSRHFPLRTDFKISYSTRDEIGVQASETKISFPDFYRQIAYLKPEIFSSAKDLFYEMVEVRDGERPEQLSYRLYESEDYYWTFFIINNKLRLGESIQWALSMKELNTLLSLSKYKNVVTAYNPRHQDALSLITKSFKIGEEVIGTNTGYRANILKIRPDYGQIFLTALKPYNVENETPFLEDNHLLYDPPELLVGQESKESIVIEKSQLFPKAVYKYFDRQTKREANNNNFIPLPEKKNPWTQVSDGELSYVSFEQHFEKKNDHLRSIKVLKKTSVLRFVDTVHELLKRNRDNRENRKR